MHITPTSITCIDSNGSCPCRYLRIRSTSRSCPQICGSDPIQRWFWSDHQTSLSGPFAPTGFQMVFTGKSISSVVEVTIVSKKKKKNVDHVLLCLQRLRILYSKILASLQTMPQDAAYRKYTEQLVHERFHHVKTVGGGSGSGGPQVLGQRFGLISVYVSGTRRREAGEENQLWTDRRSHLPGGS